jgi:hypothetical protein
MRHSVETRLFLDYRQFCIIAFKLKNKKEGWTKYILRKGINDLLPESIV